MAACLATTRAERGETTVVTLSGSLIEGACAALLAACAGAARRLELDLELVTVISSLGVREWSAFLRQVEPKHELILSGCPRSVLVTIEMVPDFLGKAHIGSIIDEWRCIRCGCESFPRVAVGRLLATEAQSRGERTCASCGGALERAFAIDDYLTILATNHP